MQDTSTSINLTEIVRLGPRIVIGALTLLFCNVLSAQVVSMSRVTEVQTDVGSYQQFSVNCGQRSEPRYIRKPSDSDQWCDSIVGTFCARQRLKVASQVCTRRYTAAVSNLEEAETSSNSAASGTSSQTSAQVTDQQDSEFLTTTQAQAAEGESPSAANQSATRNTSRPAGSTSRADLENELRDIEQKLIDLQAKKLELRAKDLELMKQQIDPGQ